MSAIADDTWPRHPDGRRKKMGELSKEQQIAITRNAVEAVAPEFAKMGVAVRFMGEREPD